MKTRRFCPKCGRLVVKSDNKDYAYQCHGCDEDFYRFEVYTTNQIGIVRNIRKIAYDYERKQGLPHVSFKQPYPKLKQK